MYKNFAFATVIIVGVFLAPVATSAALAPPATHVVASAPSAQSVSGVSMSSARLSVPGAPATQSVPTVSGTGRTELPPVQMIIVWGLLALIALTISYRVVHLLRRVEDD